MTAEANGSPAGTSPARRAGLPLVLLLSVFLFFFACVPDPISDLTLVEVKRLPASSLPPGEDLRDEMARRGEAVWRLSFSGEAGWMRQLRRHEMNGYAKVLRCDDRKVEVLALGPYVGNVKASYYGEGFEAFDPGESRTFRYDVYIPSKGTYHSSINANEWLSPHDFDREQVELCVRLAGGSMLGAYNESNEARATIGRKGPS